MATSAPWARQRSHFSFEPAVTITRTPASLASVVAAQRVRHAHGRSVMDHRLLGVTAAGKQGHGALANLPSAHLGADLDHFAGAFEPENGGSAGRRRIVTFALQQIGAIDGGRAHANAQLIGP